MMKKLKKESPEKAKSQTLDVLVMTCDVKHVLPAVRLVKRQQRSMDSDTDNTEVKVVKQQGQVMVQAPCR